MRFFYNINRLTGMTDGTNTETYTYDAVGNRTMTGYTTGAFNRLTATSANTYLYDANGSQYRKTDTTYVSDRENRLVSVVNGDTMQFAYDALGRRVSSTHIPFIGHIEAPVPERYTYDGQDVILDDNTESERPTVYYQNAPGIDNKLGMNDGRAKYFMQDHLGSTVGLTNSGGSWFETNSYDSFGNPSNSSFGTRYQFTGREFDKFSGLQYSRARFYDPQIGRFISEDPIGFAGGDVNLYSYVRNNPSNLIDPTGNQGHHPQTPFGFGAPSHPTFPGQPPLVLGDPFATPLPYPTLCPTPLPATSRSPNYGTGCGGRAWCIRITALPVFYCLGGNSCSGFYFVPDQVYAPFFWGRCSYLNPCA